MGELLTVRQLQARLKISPKTAYELVKTPGFPVCRIGGKIMVAEEKLNEWIEAGGTVRTRGERRRA